jgi:glycogen operon protein
MAQHFETAKGTASPLGSSIIEDGINFALFSAHASAVTLCLFSEDGRTETQRIDLAHRTGDIWHCVVKGLKAGALYGYRVDGPYTPKEGHRFNANKLLIDPYAKDLFGEFIQHDALYGYVAGAPEADLSFDERDSAPYVPKCVAGPLRLKWQNIERPDTPLADTIIYEAHIKGLTKRHPEIAPVHQGTLSGLSNPAIISHLTELGVTAIELLPAQSFFSEPRLTELGLTNYWGYNPINYFALYRAYLGEDGAQSWANAVEALHGAGIEVILDVVYNHTAESWEHGPTLSYRGIDNASYYQLKKDARYYVNHTGTGNTLDMSHPAVLNLTLESLRYWVQEMRVDGFRFDLGPILGRNPNEFDPQAPLFKAIAADPILSKVKMIAEPWDIGPGGYQLGNFPKGWSEWSDQYRDAVRSFWKGDASAHQNLAGRLLGSAETFEKSERSPQASINFVAAHDGFTLRDTVSYNNKHNHANGEDNRDGHGHNLSDNMGVEGPTEDDFINAVRLKRSKNMLATLMLSQGVPMLLGGDEFGHSMGGNNNAYCQDNDTTWLNWANADSELLAFTKELIALRKSLPHFRQSAYRHGEIIRGTAVKDADWIRADGQPMHPGDWENPEFRCFALLLSLPDEDTLAVVLNRGGDIHAPWIDNNWSRLLTTATAQPGDVILADSVSVFKYQGYFTRSDIREKNINEAARAFGIFESYRDINGNIHPASLRTKEKLLEALNVDPMMTETKAVPSFPEPSDHHKVYGADMLRETGRCWGVTAALYSLRSDRNWGLGDFEDLAQLCEIMADKGADFIGINPVHALFPAAPWLYSPYSPSSRQFLNVMLIAPDKIPDFPKGYLQDIKPQDSTADIDYEGIYGAKMTAFETAFEHFSKLKPDAARQKSFQAFVQKGGSALHHHALYEAIFETLPKSKQSYEGWKNFDPKYAKPASKACQDFAKKHANRVEFYTYLHWVAETQLKEAQSRAKAAGMSIGVYLDFAVGIVPGGAGTWHDVNAFAKGVSLGAPGDFHNPDGQVWNLSAFNPHLLVENNYEPYRSALRKAMSLGGAIRIDHILGHLRSFWTPQDAPGGYVSYPFDGLIQMIAEESQAQNCVVFGEDLGTVPDDFRDRMARYELMGCNVILFERDSAGHLLPRENIRELSITAFSNHDFPTMTGFWNGEDFRWREALGIGDNPDTLAWEKQRRENDKSALLKLIGITEGQPMTPRLMANLQAYFAASNVMAFAVQLDDLMMNPLQANVPGTTDEQPNWRRRAKLTLAEIASDDDISEICLAIDTARKGI